jgi:hypothetical protein
MNSLRNSVSMSRAEIRAGEQFGFRQAMSYGLT